jgi:hypothetical protein
MWWLPWLILTALWLLGVGMAIREDGGVTWSTVVSAALPFAIAFVIWLVRRGRRRTPRH